jgi:hypothetical protein
VVAEVPMAKRQVRLDDGFLYEIRRGIVYGQVHRDSPEMDRVVDAAVVQQVKQALESK